MTTSAALDPQTLPRHVAIIMDGNGRWAEERHQPRLFGHRAGVTSVRTVVECARELGIAHLTLYAFSTENWRRPLLEVGGLMALLRAFLESELDNMLRNDVRLSCLGQKERLPDDVRQMLDLAMERTSVCGGLVLNLALSYGSRGEMVEAARSLAARCLAGELRPEDFSEELFASAFYSAGQPDPDLLIRTGGERRLSNFLLWQLSYAELYFTETKWPDFGRAEFTAALLDFQQRQRRFGRTGAQLQA
ncbi:MAG: isoprenyl transferase [Desulfobulbaceae bacterium A2]|nr:MAG: isoprenyl transferase [Desulfobulbaceae bacterium A2]